jgi:glycolate oxidase FAD binding subunit
MEPSLNRIIESVRAAALEPSPVRIRGSGSKDFFGEAFDPSMPVLETGEHHGVVSYEPSELVITVKAGTPLAQVEAVLAEKGQAFPFEPPHFGPGCTIGGMVASGLSGPARASCGSVRDYVLGAHLINGRAELLEFGGTVMKNVAGYDVSRVLAGSMGSLGVIAQVSLKVLPLAPAQATLRFEMQEGEAISQLNRWAGQPLPLNASSWVMDAGVPALYLRLSGAVAAVESACKRLAVEAGGVRVDSAQTHADWVAARDLQLPWFQAGIARGDDLWRLSVPQTTPPLGVGDTMIDWLGGQRWVFAASGDVATAKNIRAVAQAAQGSAMLFRASRAASMTVNGQNDVKIPRFDAPSPVLAGIHRQLKREFDPQGIFNPGRLGVI